MTAATFRIPFWRMYLPAAVYAQVLYAPLMWLVFFLMSGGRGLTGVHVVMYAAGSAMIAGLLAPAFLVYVHMLKVTVSAAGLTCSNGFGKLETAPWDTISGVKRLAFPGFPYLLVGWTGGRLKLWLPLFLGRFDEFVAAVEDHAGPGHVLNPHLWRAAEKG